MSMLALGEDDNSIKEREVAPPPGELPEVLAGRYQLERLLGAGGMGAVYRARDLLHEQFGDPAPYVALKVLSDEFAVSPDASTLLYSEFALTRHLRHPNVVRMHSFEVDIRCQRAFITMELMRGLTLDKLLCERPLGLTWTELRGVVLPLLDALVHSHARGVIHGDLKPSNVMLCDGSVRLFDFGLSQAEEGVLTGLARLSRERFSAWTPRYAAPELQAGGPLSVSCDVFAVACVIYELAGGNHPYRHLPTLHVRNAGLDDQLRAPRHLPGRCWPALRRALALDPSARSASVVPLQHVFGQPSSWFKRILRRE